MLLGAPTTSTRSPPARPRPFPRSRADQYLKSNVGIGCYLNDQLLQNHEMSLKGDNWDMTYRAKGRYVPDRIFLTEGLAGAMGLMT